MSDSEIKALIIEDNAEHELLLRNLLESAAEPRFSVYSAATLAEGCAYLAAFVPDIVLLDLTLPDSEGIETFERVTVAAGHVPVVVLSGTGDVSLAVQTVHLGAQDYLVKGHVDNHLLLRSIQYAIERKRAQAELRRAYDELETRVTERTASLQEANEALKHEIEDRKRAETAALESNRQLADALSELRTMQHEIVQRERLKALGQMADGIAHEFNNVLTPVLGFSEHLLNRPEILADPTLARGYIAKIADAARSGAKAIARVRDFARAEAGDLGPVPVEDMVQSSVSITEPLWRDDALKAGKTVFISQRIGDVPAIFADAGQIREVLMQLIFNAVKAIEQRGLIAISAERRGGGVAISVEDDGKGMTETERLRLLDPKACNTPSPSGPDGYGVIHRILERHGGLVDIVSAKGKGTKVTIIVPAVGADHGQAASSAPTPESTAQPPPSPAAAMRILVADDEPMVRDVICIYLREDGHEVDVAEDGKQAFELFCQGNYDVVMTDRAMPEMNGDQLAVEVKRRRPEVPVILLTGFGDAMNDEGEIPPGVDEVVAKPFTISDIREVLAPFGTRKRG